MCSIAIPLSFWCSITSFLSLTDSMRLIHSIESAFGSAQRLSSTLQATAAVTELVHARIFYRTYTSEE